MSFAKALQNTHPTEFEAYSKAIASYKLACSVYRKIHREYQNATDPAGMLFFLKAQRDYKKACREYYEARQHWENVVASERLKLDGTTEITAATVIKLAGLKTPLTLKEIIKELREGAIERSLTPEEWKIGMEAKARAIAREQGKELPPEFSKSTKDTFLSEKEDDPTAGDFEPLPPAE